MEECLCSYKALGPGPIGCIGCIGCMGYIACTACTRAHSSYTVYRLWAHRLYRLYSLYSLYSLVQAQYPWIRMEECLCSYKAWAHGPRPYIAYTAYRLYSLYKPIQGLFPGLIAHTGYIGCTACTAYGPIGYIASEPIWPGPYRYIGIPPCVSMGFPM